MTILSQRKSRLVIAVLFVTLLLISLVASEAFDGLASTTNLSQSPSVRKLEMDERTMIPKGVIEIVNIGNLQAENFPEGFEVEVKNISDKPIYGIYFLALFEESRQIYGRLIAFSLKYGASRLITTRALAQEGDIPLRPGESAVLKLDPRHVQGLLKQVEKNSAFATRGRSRVTLSMQHINFGDGTGHVPGGFYPVHGSNTGYAPGGFYPLSRPSREEFTGFRKGLFTNNAENLGFFASSSKLVYLNIRNYFPCDTCLRGTTQNVPSGCPGGCDYTCFCSGGGDDPCQEFYDATFYCREYLCSSWATSSCPQGCY